MERVVEFVGKKVQDAVDEGLKTLGISLDDADIKIISNGGLFKKAKVEIRYDDGLTEEEAAAAEEKKAQEKAKAEAEEKKAQEKSGAPEDEPRWGSAPVKREPTVKPRTERKNEKTEENKEQPRKENKERKPRETVLPTDEQVAAAKEFVTELLAKMNIEGTAEVVVDEGLRVNVDTEDARVIGHRGEVLDSIAQVVSAVVNASHGKFVHVTVDGLGYRDRRKETLESIAARMADKAVRTHRKVTLDPMNSADRRIIHAALGDREDVFTRSEGHEPARRVAIIPKRK